jgi:hypothetical protein
MGVGVGEQSCENVVPGAVTAVTAVPPDKASTATYDADWSAV